jgi:uncharacterized membrane protein
VKLARPACAAFFVGAGILHFVRPRMYEQIVPPGFGDPATVVAISGAAEIVGGLALAGLAARRIPRWWLIGLLVAVFPANVYMAVDPDRAGGSGLPGWLLWARLPLQGVLIYWVLRATRRQVAIPAAAPLAAAGP